MISYGYAIGKILILDTGCSSTVWKFDNFAITQILREIKIGGSRSAKSAIFAILEALNFDIYKIFALFEG